MWRPQLRDGAVLSVDCHDTGGPLTCKDGEGTVLNLHLDTLHLAGHGGAAVGREYNDDVDGHRCKGLTDGGREGSHVEQPQLDRLIRTQQSALPDHENDGITNVSGGAGYHHLNRSLGEPGRRGLHGLRSLGPGTGQGKQGFEMWCRVRGNTATRDHTHRSSARLQLRCDHLKSSSCSGSHGVCLRSELHWQRGYRTGDVGQENRNGAPAMSILRNTNIANVPQGAGGLAGFQGDPAKVTGADNHHAQQGRSGPRWDLPEGMSLL